MSWRTADVSTPNLLGGDLDEAPPLLSRWGMASPTPHDDSIRPGEISVPLPDHTDAGIYFIGRIRTPWLTRRECPRRGDLNGPICSIEVDPRWSEALTGIETHPRIQVLYWMHQARRDLVLQRPGSSGPMHATFALRSPVRPNPIASSVVALVGRSGTVLTVRGLDCVDGTPLVDLKPERGLAESGLVDPGH